MFSDIGADAIAFLSSLLVFVLGIVALVIIIIFLIDTLQTRDAIRHNYPVIGRFRYIFTTLGEFFRQYFFAMDREEMPFNRAEREWVYRSSAGADNTVAFGSTKNINPVGTALFVNCPFPTLEEHATEPPTLTIGQACNNPYKPKSLVNISGMSYGAISKPAVKALSRGAKLADCWLNTGEGGLSDYHLEGQCDIVIKLVQLNTGLELTTVN